VQPRTMHVRGAGVFRGVRVWYSVSFLSPLRMVSAHLAEYEHFTSHPKR